MPHDGDIACGEDEQEIKDHIQYAHGNVEDAGDAHVAAAAQHRTRHNIDHEERNEQHEGAKVQGGIGADMLFGAKPYGQRPT